MKRREARDVAAYEALFAPAREAASGLRGALRYSNVPEGLIAVSMLLGTYALLGLPPDGPLLVLAFCGTFLVYQADRALGFAPEDLFNRPERCAWVRRHRTFVRGASLLALAGAGAVLPFLQPATLATGVGLALLGAGYVAPLLPHRRRLKTIWFLKPLAVAAAWSLGGVIMPLVEAGAPLATGAAALVGYRFLFVLPNALLADRADRRGDARAGLRTVATEYSPAWLQAAAVGALGVAVTGAGMALAFYGATRLLAVDVVGPLLLLALVGCTSVSPRRPLRLLTDLVMAWPAVTAAVAWLAG